VDVHVWLQGKQFKQVLVLFVVREGKLEALSEIREIFTRRKKWQLR
jgi:hypothetical protein